MIISLFQQTTSLSPVAILQQYQRMEFIFHNSWGKYYSKCLRCLKVKNYVAVITNWLSSRTGWPFRNIHFSMQTFTTFDYMCNTAVSYKKQTLHTLHEHLYSPVFTGLFLGEFNLLIFIVFSVVLYCMSQSSSCVLHVQCYPCLNFLFLRPVYYMSNVTHVSKLSIPASCVLHVQCYPCL